MSPLVPRYLRKYHRRAQTRVGRVGGDRLARRVRLRQARVSAARAFEARDHATCAGASRVQTKLVRDWVLVLFVAWHTRFAVSALEIARWISKRLANTHAFGISPANAYGRQRRRLWPGEVDWGPLGNRKKSSVRKSDCEHGVVWLSSAHSIH